MRGETVAAVDYRADRDIDRRQRHVAGAADLCSFQPHRSADLCVVKDHLATADEPGAGEQVLSDVQSCALERSSFAA